MTVKKVNKSTYQLRLRQIGKQIETARVKAELSVRELSKIAGISHATLWRIEKGSPGVSMGAVVKVWLTLGINSNL